MRRSTFSLRGRLGLKAPQYRAPSVVLACPDARQPAYEAAAGLAEENLLAAFCTAGYYSGGEPWSRLARYWFSRRFSGIERRLLRRQHRDIPAKLVRPDYCVDLSSAIENRVRGLFRRILARRRVERFDRRLARLASLEKPDVLFVFSDVASELTLLACRRVGIASVLSVVHGDIDEEHFLLENESKRAPDFFPIYLSDGCLDRVELDWLHARRRREVRLADIILVPSSRIAAALIGQGVDHHRIQVVPYAADLKRFRPRLEKSQRDECTFLFAGGITQRKGIKYLLEAWSAVRRPGWRLQLLGALPRHVGPLSAYFGDPSIEWLGRVGHAEMPTRLASADVFVFPSLFEGSAVVTYEALACGLPSIVSDAAGSVVREGLDGFIVPAGDSEVLASRMIRLGSDPALRAEMAIAARRRAEQFDWHRYRRSVVQAVSDAALGLRQRRGANKVGFPVDV
jgi:starch synthase